MTKLKTLKDINVNYEGMNQRDSICLARQIIRYKKCLRQEAIKWIRANYDVYDVYARPKVPSWILGFFNLTEEDLK